MPFGRFFMRPAKLGGVGIRNAAMMKKKDLLAATGFSFLDYKNKEMSPLPNPPKSIEELTLMAKMHTDKCIPTDIYVNSANLLLKQARIYFREENEEQAYIYYLKYIK